MECEAQRSVADLARDWAETRAMGVLAFREGDESLERAIDARAAQLFDMLERARGLGADGARQTSEAG